ncbi:MAG: DUF1002 domain-containing protein [Lachnospiraceae bacterium]|nr:DUF1002 domain-containing protein [Lachnospiraceae bacterium]
MKMKRCIAILLAAVLAIPLAACGDAADVYEIDTDSQTYKDYLAGELSESEIEKLMEEAEKTDGTLEDKAQAEEDKGSGKKEEKSWKSGKNEGDIEEKKDTAADTGKTDTGKTGDSNETQTGPSKNYVALGKNLSDSQLATVLELMGITEDELKESDVVYVTNEEEHAFLDDYIDPAKIGKNALSSVLVIPAEKGHGIEVTTKNINYCTPEMYENAFMTAGVNDADIIVAGPFELSGTAALIGAVKAYERLSGVEISDMVVDAAVDELITTGDIAEKLASKEDAAKLIALIKKEIITKNPGSKAEVEAIVRGAQSDLGLTLPDEYIDRIVDLIMKIVKAFAMQKLMG